jgi:hypothetical protein
MLYIYVLIVQYTVSQALKRGINADMTQEGDSGEMAGDLNGRRWV